MNDYLQMCIVRNQPLRLCLDDLLYERKKLTKELRYSFD
jgi:hypothetical protein